VFSFLGGAPVLCFFFVTILELKPTSASPKSMFSGSHGLNLSPDVP